jgi:hypothetical protein
MSGSVKEDSIGRIRMLVHSLGLDQAKKSYRNHYCCDENEDCRALVEHGLFVSRHNPVPTGGMLTYLVTDTGKKAVEIWLFLNKRNPKVHCTYCEAKGYTLTTQACIALEKMGLIRVYQDQTTTRIWELAP